MCHWSQDPLIEIFILNPSKMVKLPQKMTKLVVSAIRNLRDAQGSTAKDILNYVTRECNSDPSIERKLQAALKRGLEYGILKNMRGHFRLNTDPETLPDSGLMDRAGRRKRHRRRRGRGGKSKSRGRGRGRRRRRRGGRRSKSHAGRRGRRGRGRRGRRSRRTKSRGNIDDVDMLAKEPIESGRQRELVNPVIEFDQDRSRSRSRHSCSQSLTPSNSRSSLVIDHEGPENHRHAE